MKRRSLTAAFLLLLSTGLALAQTSPAPRPDCPRNGQCQGNCPRNGKGCGNCNGAGPRARNGARQSVANNQQQARLSRGMRWGVR